MHVIPPPGGRARGGGWGQKWRAIPWQVIPPRDFSAIFRAGLEIFLVGKILGEQAVGVSRRRDIQMSIIGRSAEMNRMIDILLGVVVFGVVLVFAAIGHDER